MSTLDEKIRERIAGLAEDGNDPSGCYTAALKAVLDAEPHPSTQARFISDQKWFHAGQEAHRLEVRQALADELGITQEAPK